MSHEVAALLVPTGAPPPRGSDSRSDMRVALFVTCVNDLMYPQTGKAVVALLERLGVTVEFPEAQTCCGQMHANSGYRDEAIPLVRGFMSTFDSYDAVVAP